MRPLTVVAIAVATALVPVSYAAEKPQLSGAVETTPGKGKAVLVLTASATVESVDPATRAITLKLPRGESRSLVAGEEVRNFDQIKVGDKLNVKYVEALALELKKDGKAIVGRTETGSLERSQPGQKPGGTAQREVTVVADVVNVDVKKQVVTVKNEKGELVDLALDDPEQVKLVKKGDQIQATYTEALAIALEPAVVAEK